MTNEKPDTSILDKLVADGMVKRKGANYIYTVGTDEVVLAKSKVDSNAKLIKLLEGNNTGSNESKPDPIKGNQDLDKDLDNQEDDNPSEFAELLGHIGDINTDVEGNQDIDISFDGVDVRQLNDPVIINLGLAFRWRNKSNSIDSGNGVTKNKGYTVMSKSFPALKKKDGTFRLVVARDDSPTMDFWSVGDLVLCAIKLSQYNERTKIKTAKAMIRDVVEKQKSDNLAQDMKNVTDVDQAVQALDSHANAGGGKRQSAESIIKKVNTSGGDEAIKSAEQLLASL